MTSLTALAHATAAAPAFNANFYITVGTVIPVLFLALAIQGTAYQDALRTARTTLLASSGDRRFRRNTGIATYTLLVLAAFFILLSGFLGELGAIHALYLGDDDPFQRRFALLATLFLLVAVVARPAWQLVRLAVSGELSTGEQQESPGGGQDTAKSAGTPHPEPGKTDPA